MLGIFQLISVVALWMWEMRTYSVHVSFELGRIWLISVNIMNLVL